MTAMKKTTSKPAAKSPAPATKAAPIVKAPVPVKKAAPALKTAKPAVKTKAAPAVAAAPAVKPVPTKPVVTSVTAQIDIGFGNLLYIRGEGPGLSWDAGLPLDCVKDDQWSIVLPETSKPIVCKFLINDLTWSAGPDCVVEPGKKVTLTPSF